MPRRIVARMMFAQYETEAALEDTIKVLKEAGFNEAMVMNCRGHCEPAHYTREQTQERAAYMLTAIERLREEGFGVSVNNLATIGMNLSPPSQHDFKIQPLIDPDGQVFPECFCPLDPKFLKYLDFLFNTWASLKPDEVWVDDDFRYKNKAAQCYCPLHLKKLEEATGKAWEREELAEALRQYPPSVPNGLSTTWSTIQKDALLNAARWIAGAVHRVNPNTPIGLMGIFTSIHHYGAEYLEELLRILNPNVPPRVRPEFCSYSDIDRLSWSAYWPRWACDRACPTDFVALPEFETWPGTQYNHSHRVLRMKYCWAAVYGFNNAAESTMWHTERYEPEFPAYQRQTRQISGGISSIINDQHLIPRGVSLELSEDRAGHNNGGDILFTDAYAVHLVSRLGLPLWPGGGHATFLTGNAPLVRRSELESMAQGGILLDRSAFNALVASGNTAISGGATSAPMRNIPVVETFMDEPENGIAGGETLSMETAATLRGSLEGYVLPDDDSFRVLSWFEDEHGEPLAPATWTREWDDKRMVVLPFDFNTTGSQFAVANWLRKSQIESLLEWAAAAPLPLRVGRAADLFSVYREAKEGDRVVIGLANYSNDPADHALLTVPLAANWEKWVVRFLDDEGYWQLATNPSGIGSDIDLQGRVTIEPMSVKLLEIAAR